MRLLLTLNNSKEWNDYLQRIPAEKRDIYYTPEYYSLYQNHGDGDACCYVFEKDNNVVLYPFLINPITPLGYNLDKEYYDIQGAYGYNGIITSNHASYIIEEFWESFDDWCKNNDVIAEFTRFHPLLNNQKLAPLEMKIFYSRHTVTLDLLDDDIWMHQINSKNRNMIRKAEKEGVVVVESEDYETFRNLYNGTMSDLQAEDFYFFPKEYYNEYKRTLKDKSLLCFAIYDEKIIAGSMFMYSEDYAHYHLSARNRDYSRYAANNLILWYGIQKAKERGCKCFHFGGGTTGYDDDSLLKFKRDFSKTMGEFWIGKRVHNKKAYDEVVRQWQIKTPELYKANEMKLLGYREI